MNHTIVKEQKAMIIAEDKRKLLARLKDELSSMKKEGQKVFKGYTFDFQNKRLLSPCKEYAIQWKLRNFPNEPENYEKNVYIIGKGFCTIDNQQCSEGICIVESVS